MSEPEGFVENVRKIPAWPKLETGFDEPNVETYWEDPTDETPDYHEVVRRDRLAEAKADHPSVALSEARKTRLLAITTALEQGTKCLRGLDSAIDWIDVYAPGRDYLAAKRAVEELVAQLKFDLNAEKNRR